MDYDWSVFAARLDVVLTELAAREEHMVLIISDSREKSCFAQYLCGGDFDGIWAEVASNKYLPQDRQLSNEDQKRLAADGWDRPKRWWRNTGVPNWSSFHSAGRGIRHRALADMTVRALRDAMRVESAQLLCYDAFVQATGEPITIDRLELPRQS
ncbi:MAG: TY-Chap domain-containing protein [Micromonosporaceae bacterium]